MELYTLLKANIKHKRGAFISILFLMFLISMCFTSVISIYDNLTNSYDEAIKKADAGDLVSYLSDTYYTKELTDALLAEENTDHVRDAEFIYVQEYTIDQKEVSNTLLNLCAWNEEHFTVMNDSLTGFAAKQDGPAKASVYIPLCMKAIAGCDIGSTLTIKTNHGQQNFTVKGFIEEPLTGSFIMSVKQVYISPEDYASLRENELDAPDQKEAVLPLYHMIHLYRSESSSLSISEYKRAINQGTPLIRYSYTTLSKEDSKYYTMLYNTIGNDILYVFLFFLCVIVLIIMGHSITTGIEMDYVNYGILKAVGFTKKKLRTMILIQYTLALFIGAIAGMLSAIVMTHYLCNLFLSITGIYTTTGLSLGKALLGVIAVLVLCVGFILIKTRKIGAIAPVRAITGNRDEIYFNDKLYLPVKKSWLHITMAFRQLTSNKKQYLAATVIAGMLVFFLMCMTILTKCITANGIAETFGGTVCDVKAVTNTDLNKEVRSEIESKITEICPLSDAEYVTHGYVLVDDCQFNSNSYSDPSKLKNIIKGRAPLYENELAVTEIAARELNKGIGDTVKVQRMDTTKEYLITGYVQTTAEVGHFVVFSLDGFANLGSIANMDCCYTLTDAAKTDDVITLLNQTYGSVLTAKDYDDGDAFLSTFEHSLSLITLVIYLISALFAFVTILMISKKSFLKEQHDIGVYKALGFTVSSLRFSFAIRFFIVAFLGSIGGLILGYLFNEPLLSTMLTTTGITSFHTTYEAFMFLAPILLVCISYFIFSYLASYKMKAVSVRQLITE